MASPTSEPVAPAAVKIIETAAFAPAKHTFKPVAPAAVKIIETAAFAPAKPTCKPAAPFAVGTAAKTAAFAVVKPASQATPAFVYLSKQQACAFSEINKQNLSLSHASIFTRPSEVPSVSAQIQNSKQRGRSTWRSSRLTPRRVDRSFSHAPRLRRLCIQPVRCDKRPTHGGSKLAQGEYPASGLKCAQPYRSTCSAWWTPPSCWVKADSANSPRSQLRAPEVETH